MLIRKKASLFKIAGIAVLFLFSLCYTQIDVSLSGLEATRFAVVQAVGEQGVFHINNTQFRSFDRIIRDGKVYSDKPLPLGWSVGLVHKIVHSCSGLNFKDNYHLLIYCYNILSGGLVNILIFVWLFDHLRRWRHGSLKKKFFIALSAGLGSWLLSYSVTINNHTPAALALLGWFIVLEKFYRSPACSTAAVAGLAAGAVAAFDLPIGFFTCLINIAALWFSNKNDWKSIGSGIAGSAAAGIFITGLNFYAYGTVLPLYIAWASGTYTPGTTQKDHLLYLAETMITYRGLFSYQPFLLFAFCALWSLRKRFSPPAWSAAAVSFVSIVFYWYMTNEYGGAAYGFRYLIPIIPVFWYFAGIWLLEQRSKLIQSLAVIFIFWGIIASLAGAYAPFGLAFEGYRSPPGHATRSIRSSFTGNLLSWSYENDPESFLTASLRKYYGQEVSRKYLLSSYLMLKKMDQLARIAQEPPAR